MLIHNYTTTSFVISNVYYPFVKSPACEFASHSGWEERYWKGVGENITSPLSTTRKDFIIKRNQSKSIRIQTRENRIRILAKKIFETNLPISWHLQGLLSSDPWSWHTHIRLPFFLKTYCLSKNRLNDETYQLWLLFIARVDNKFFDVKIENSRENCQGRNKSKKPQLVRRDVAASNEPRPMDRDWMRADFAH